MSFRSGCGPEVEVADLLDAVLAPELVTLQGILGIGVHNDRSAVPAPEKEHPLNLMKLHFLLVFQPDRVAILADRVANFAEEEIANHG